MIDIDDDDDFLTEFSSNNGQNDIEEIYIAKMILNALRHWRGSFSDENLLRAIIGRFPGERVKALNWSKEIEARDAQWRKSNEDYPSSFPAYGKFLTREDIIEVIIKPSEQAIPEIAAPFSYTQTGETLANLLDCTEYEKLFLQFVLLTRSFPYNSESVMPRILSCFDHKEEAYAAMLGIPREEVKKVLNGFLFKSGFIVPTQYPDGYFKLSEVFEQVFEDKNIGESQIESLLFPNNLSTDLTVADYEHIKNDVMRTESIFNHALTTKATGANIMLWGPPGTGKTELAIAMAKKNGWHLKSIGDISDTDMKEKSRTDRLSNLKIALKLFDADGQTVLLFDEIEDLFKTDNNASFSKAFINRIIETTKVPIIWTTNHLPVIGEAVLRRMTYNICCTTPSRKARRSMWDKYAQEFNVTLDDSTRKMLDAYDISPALIKSTMRVTSTVLQGSSDASQKDIREIVQSLDRLVHFGQKRRFETEIEDPNEVYDVSFANADRDLEQFADSLKRVTSPAFAICMYGVPGSGKSRYARYIAKTMDKPVMFRRASDLVSPFVGETEMNIAATFEQAKEDGAVLIIDEGDSFLQDRTNAHRSWEISQVNEMLSQMESHPEPFIITTNLMDNLDPASLRRFTFKMKFDYLKPGQARHLFEAYYRVPAPQRIERNHLLTPGDISCVQRQVKILGIRNGEEIYKMIEHECSLKPDFSKSIGF